MGAHSHDHLEFFWWVAEGSLVEAQSGFSSNHRSHHLGWRQVWGNDTSTWPRTVTYLAARTELTLTHS